MMQTQEKTSSETAQLGIDLSTKAFGAINEALPYYLGELNLPLESEQLTKAFQWFADTKLGSEGNGYSEASTLLNCLMIPNSPIMLVMIAKESGTIQPLLIPHIGRLIIPTTETTEITVKDDNLNIYETITPELMQAMILKNEENKLPDTFANTIVFFARDQDILLGHRLRGIAVAASTTESHSEILLMETLIPLYIEIKKLTPLIRL